MNVDLLRLIDSGIIVCQLARRTRVGADQRNAIVDIQDLARSALTLHIAGRRHNIFLCVYSSIRPAVTAREGSLCRECLCSVGAEIVRAVEVAGNAAVELGVSMIC